MTATKFMSHYRGAVLATLLVTLLGFTAAPTAWAASDQQALVDKAALTAERLLADPQRPTLRKYMARAKGVLVVPSLIKGGFIFGIEGGSGVLLARGDKGWSHPSFFTIGAGSIGIQAGIQDAQVMLVIMTDKGLRAVIKRQFKFGVDASAAIGPGDGIGAGAGVGSATTAGLGADIYSFSDTRGLFAGASFEGAAVVKREDWNRAYYGDDATTNRIVLEGKAANQGADRLRRALMGK
ncbi:MAG: lipid-binding SYLF domain-containing protein [Alphaproteobacteria bacterium]